MRTKTLLISALMMFSSALPALGKDTLTIYTYESFTAEWGPGPKIEQNFETQCGCDLKFVAVADGVALFNRVKIEGQATEADIVLGLDTNLTVEAAATGLFAGHGINLENVNVPGGWKDDVFVPFDYGYFAVVYDTEKMNNPPESLAELTNMAADVKIAIQDPRTSTPGLGLVLWMKSVFGDDAPSAWARLKDKILTVTPGWSEAYGLFTSGEAEMVLSYTTSPAYHKIAENSDRYKAASFAEGHYLQIEVAAMTLKGAGNPLARQFLEFMTGPGFQDVIPQTNWMMPAGRMSKPLDPVFDTLVKPAKPLLFDPETVAENRKEWVAEWLSVLGR